MRLSEITTTAKSEFTSPKDVLKMIKLWHERNTPKIGDLKLPKQVQTVDMGTVLYRGIVLDSEELQDLQDGEEITLPSKGFSSWSEDVRVAKEFAHGAGSGTGIVIKKPASKLQIWLNVDEFMFQNKFNAEKELQRPNEREIIVKETEPLVISTSDLSTR